MQVDFPEPLGPITATNSPRSISRSIPRSAAWRLARAIDLGDIVQRDDGLFSRLRVHPKKIH